MPGPAPKLDPARRHTRVGPVHLPAEGRSGPVPRWPLGPPPEHIDHKRELAIWRGLWHTPQSVAWERLGWLDVVARYARVCVGAELLSKDCMAEARQLEDRLGLTPKAMRMLLWEVVSDQVAEKREENATSARGRIKAVG